MFIFSLTTTCRSVTEPANSRNAQPRVSMLRLLTFAAALLISVIVSPAVAQDVESPDQQIETHSGNATATETLDSSEPDVFEFTVEDESEVERLRESAQAVHVIDTEAEKKLSADLGELLARSQGVGVRRAGGLGSNTRFSLNGLVDDQIRFFIDGIPLDMAGYAFGLSEVPVNLIERVEIYRGVVPVRFGADALGGAVNLVSDDTVASTNGSLSYQAGSFGTQRATLHLHHLDEPSGFFARLNAYYDQADNDYEIDIEVPNEVGRLQPATVKRFHDTYEGKGANLQLGLVDKPWAERLQLTLFSSGFDKDIQHNSVMTVPYGEARYDIETSGFSLRYQQSLTDSLLLDAALGQSETTTNFLDVADVVYNWFGDPIFDRITPGELGTPADNVVWDDSQFLRVNFDWTLDSGQQLKFSLAPTWTDRHGKSRLLSEGTRDPLSADRELLTLVAGVEYHADFFQDRLENIFFVKHYHQEVRSEEPINGTFFRRKDRDVGRQGFGNSLRYRINDWSYAKASYEYATRLPRPDEIFGNAVQIQDNLDLEEEVSHNYNLGVTVDGLQTDRGVWRGEANLFVRDAENIIVLLGADQFYTYQNVFGAISKGLEAAAGWTSPSGFVSLDGNFTWLDFRNDSNSGTFGDFDGDRIPNRPYQFANGAARLNWYGVFDDYDELSLSLNTRYVHAFFRGWESVGLREFKETVPSQTTHSLGMTYQYEMSKSTLSLSAEVQNLMDEKAYDFFGVQRPGRAFYVKATLDF